MLVFDLETTGLPAKKTKDQYFHPSETKYYDSSRIVQLGYISEKSEHSFVVKFQKNQEIPFSHLHRITMDKSQKEGIEIQEILKIFYAEIVGQKILVSHNIDFDYNILLSEMYRNGLKNEAEQIQEKVKNAEIQLYCTMKNGAEKLKLTKWPKLVELHSLLYPKENVVQKHDALEDSRLCLKCYDALKILDLNK